MKQDTESQGRRNSARVPVSRGLHDIVEWAQYENLVEYGSLRHIEEVASAGAALRGVFGERSTAARRCLKVLHGYLHHRIGDERLSALQDISPIETAQTLSRLVADDIDRRLEDRAFTQCIIRNGFKGLDRMSSFEEYLYAAQHLDLDDFCEQHRGTGPAQTSTGTTQGEPALARVLDTLAGPEPHDEALHAWMNVADVQEGIEAYLQETDSERLSFDAALTWSRICEFSEARAPGGFPSTAPGM